MWSSSIKEFFDQIGGVFYEIRTYFIPGLRKSNFGRLDGWYIEYQGETIGELVDYRWNDMFWDSYRLIPKEDDHCKELLRRDDLWLSWAFQYVNKRTLIRVDHAIPPSEAPKGERISIGHLYLTK